MRAYPRSFSCRPLRHAPIGPTDSKLVVPHRSEKRQRAPKFRDTDMCRDLAPSTPPSRGKCGWVYRSCGGSARWLVGFLPEETCRFQLLRDPLDRPLHVRRLPRARADELPGPEQEDDDLRLVDPVHEPGELLRLVLDLLQPEGDRDRVQVDLRAQVRRRDDVLDLDLRVLLDRDPRGLDLLRDGVDRGLHVLEGLRARAYDLPAPEEERGGLRLLQTADEPGDLLRLVLPAAASQA